MTPSDRRGYIDHALIEGLATVASTCGDDAYWDAGEDERLNVTPWQVSACLACPAKEAALALTSFEPNVRTVRRAAALEALHRLRQGASSPPNAYVTAFKNGDADRWPWQWPRSEATLAEKAALAQAAVTFVASTARVLGSSLSSASRIGWRPDWLYPNRALRLAGRIDAVIQVDGGPALVIFFNGAWNSHARAEVAYEVVLASIGRLDVQRAIACFPDVGVHANIVITVDLALLDEGIAAACRAASVVATKAGFLVENHARTPGVQCRHCKVAADCNEGQAWLAGPGTRRFGFPVARRYDYETGTS